MKNIFFLSGEHPELAREEVIELSKPKSFKLLDRFLIAEHSCKSLEKRLAYTHTIYNFLFECTPETLESSIKKFNWKKIYKKDFCLRIINENHYKFQNEKELASLIWKNLIKPKVNLKNPSTEITFFVFENTIICGLLKHRITKDFNERRPHLRPALHPTSLHPKLARACINLTGINNKKSKIADLLCGSGGILIEIGLMGFRPVGVDNDKGMLWRAGVNLDYFKIKGYKLVCADSTKFKQKLDYVVSDFPYGKNTKKAELSELEKFYLSFLANLRKILVKKAVIIFPDFSDYKTLLKKSKFRLEKEFTIYIHNSLSRKICLIS